MSQTAVKWLETQIVKFHNWKLNPIYDKNCFDEIELTNAIQKAKEMEKQQIIDAYQNGDNNGADRIYYHSNRDDKSAEQYYNEIFKK